jgi:hypothetical protein
MGLLIYELKPNNQRMKLASTKAIVRFDIGPILFDIEFFFLRKQSRLY